MVDLVRPTSAFATMPLGWLGVSQAGRTPLTLGREPGVLSTEFADAIRLEGRRITRRCTVATPERSPWADSARFGSHASSSVWPLTTGGRSLL
jgi:hypothetical protein